MAHGLWAVHAILAFVLIAAGEVRKLATAMALSVLPALLLFVALIEAYQGVGAAIASACVPALGSGLFFVLLRARLGPFLPRRSLRNVAAASVLMFASAAAVGSDGLMVFVACPLGLVTYGAAVWFLGEVRSEELSRLMVRPPVELAGRLATLVGLLVLPACAILPARSIRMAPLAPRPRT